MTIAIDTVRESDYDRSKAQEFARAIAEFLEISVEAAWDRLEGEFHNSGSQVAEAWRSASPKTPEEIERFYRETDCYIFDLAADHCRARRIPVQEAILARIDRRGTGQRVLLYGDGIGTDSIAVARRGHHVTYFDLPGMSSKFAKFRFEHENSIAPIRIVESTQEITEGDFDAVVCVEVLEHVPNPLDVMRRLHRALKPRGVAIITESFGAVGPEFPSHLLENLQYAGKTHRMMERLGFADTYYNQNPLNYPMEFTRIQSGPGGGWLQLRGRARRAINTRLALVRSWKGR